MTPEVRKMKPTIPAATPSIGIGLFILVGSDGSVNSCRTGYEAKTSALPASNLAAAEVKMASTRSNLRCN
tara:strand:- start:13 stop:222 length:210 start_codon:yes stop_codon:yes gene_type:complete